MGEQILEQGQGGRRKRQPHQAIGGDDAGVVIAQQQATELMGQLGLPTRDDVRELVRRVDTLRQKLV